MRVALAADHGGAELKAELLARLADAGIPLGNQTVLLRGVNDDEALSLLHFCLRSGYELRFIEWMPMAEGDAYVPGAFLSAAVSAVVVAVTAERDQVPVVVRITASTSRTRAKSVDAAKRPAPSCSAMLPSPSER